jgi:predicted nucleic acid-binding protein
MRTALDTNILAYAEGLGDALRCQSAIELLGRLTPANVVVPAQTLGELTRLLVSKARRTTTQARDAILGWADGFPVADSTWTAFQSALDLQAHHPMQIWDALILAVASEQRCRVLLSEDLQDGFTWGGVTVVNPFSSIPLPLLSRVF